MCRTLAAVRRISAYDCGKYRRPRNESCQNGTMMARGERAERTCAAMAPLSFLRLEPEETTEGLAFESWEVSGVDGRSLIFSGVGLTAV